MESINEEEQKSSENQNVDNNKEAKELIIPALNFDEELKNPTNKTLEKMKYINYDKVYNKEYGIYHFKVPNPYQRIASFDCSGETYLFTKLVTHDYTKFYKPMTAPGKDDWLMNHKEYGQTYREYKNFGHHNITKQRHVIYIAPLSFNINPAFDKSFITAMIILCQSYYYDMEIKLLNMNINLEGVEYRNYEDGSYQLNANTIIEKLFYEMPSDGYCLVCLTDIDLYNDVRVIKPRKWTYFPPPYKNDFCYELNSFKYWVSICSIARFDPIYSMEKIPNDDDLKIKLYFVLLKRAAKIVIKNIGHMFGLKNCIFFKCIMNGFGHLKEFDGRPIELCPSCLRKIFTNISRKFENISDEGRVLKDRLIFDRFLKIKECLEDNFVGTFEGECKWYDMRIKSLMKELGIK